MNEKLRNWVAIGELVAAAGVMISLIFVGYELNSGNKIQQAANDNFLYELQDELYADLSTNPVLISAYTKLSNGDEELTRQEAAQYVWYIWRYVNQWSMAFDRHAEGLLSDSTWAAWSTSFESELVGNSIGMSKELWESGRNTYREEFTAYVDNLYLRLEN